MFLEYLLGVAIDFFPCGLSGDVEYWFVLVVLFGEYCDFVCGVLAYEDFVLFLSFAYSSDG